MVHALQIACLLLVAVAMGLALAHALEMPGKMRLDREPYFAVQEIYYPGFTIGGAAEPLGIVALPALLVQQVQAGGRPWWVAAALLALIGMQAVYWLVTHPVNSVWTKGLQLDDLAARFFSTQDSNAGDDWQHHRYLWEYSHVARAVLGGLGLVFLAIAAVG